MKSRGDSSDQGELMQGNANEPCKSLPNSFFFFSSIFSDSPAETTESQDKKVKSQPQGLKSLQGQHKMQYLKITAKFGHQERLMGAGGLQWMNTKWLQFLML